MLDPLDFQLPDSVSLSFRNIYLSTKGLTPGTDTAMIVALTSATSTHSSLRNEN